MFERHGIWAIAPDRLETLLSENAFERVGEPRRRERAYVLDRGVAILDVDGVLTKGGSWYGSSAEELRMQLLTATQDEAVHAIVLRVCSPGGEMAGIDELAQAYAAAGQVKPTATFYEDLGASAAVFVGSQGNKSYANRTAAIGSIGVYCVVLDMSAAAEQAGIKVHVVKSAEHKGDGVPGTPITDEMLGEKQRFVDEAHDLFVRTVAAGRGLSLAKTRELADGRIHTAGEAKTLGLIDDVRTLESVIDSLAAKRPKQTQPKSKGARAMSEETTVVEAPAVPRAATLQELKAELVGADATFLVGQLELNATLPQAQKAWSGELAARNQAAAEKLAAAEAKLAEAEKARAAAGVRPGVEPLPGGNAAEVNAAAGPAAVAAWKQLVDAKVKSYEATAGVPVTSPIGGMPSRIRAQIECARENPEAHEAYLAAYNAAHRKKFGVKYAMRLNDAATVKN